MIEILNRLAESFSTIFNLATNIIMSFVNLFVKIPSYSQFLISSINLLPIILLPFALASLSIYIVIFIVGR